MLRFRVAAAPAAGEDGPDQD
ncbi:hypothetical protein FRAAL4861 [Frankia alni ACN14a]|uniref:Uncharacterized protein n=1 Tax=Frankia alni (strain DSM 45986 / CECT 9034 / ACN14a) TaxID=326424 RepID=Q0RG87_FRAAA|nr:hypothetical protein FRAAL4861 [Frankia alni ACN14a]